MDKKKIYVINGPNMNLLGEREKEIYGNEGLEVLENRISSVAELFSMDTVFFQSNHEGEIIDFIQGINKGDRVVINPSAYSYAGYGIVEALSAKDIAFIEVHMSNIFSRGGWHAQSVFSEYAKGCIVGLGIKGYELAVRAFAEEEEE